MSIGEGASGVTQAAAARELAESLGAAAMAHEARLYEGLGLLERDRSQPQGKEALSAAIDWLVDNGRLAALAPFVINPAPLSAVGGAELEGLAARLDAALAAARDALGRAGGDNDIAASGVEPPAEGTRPVVVDEAEAPELRDEAAEPA